MSGFENREKGFETKFAHEEKVSFEVEARCSKIYGLWAAEKLGITGPEAEAYARTVVEANLDEPGFEDVYRKVRADFDEKGLDVDEKEMRVELDRALTEAQHQLSNE